MSKILIIDDDELVLDMMQAGLQDEGYEVTVAVNGEEGIQRYREDPADVVITDVIMPEKEGIETFLELKREFPGVKVITMSGGGRISADDYLETAKCLGADYTFQKPVEHDQLIDAIETLLAPEPR